jgi:L-asparaginase
MGGTDTAHNTINQHSDTLRLPLCVGYVASARPNSALSADGPMNFAQNLQVIRDPSSWGYGAFMAFNERIWGPFLLYKRTTNGLDMFDSAAGPLGIMKGGKPHFWYGPREHRGRLHFDIKKLAPIKPPRVVITYATEPETVVTLLHDPEVAGVVIIGQGAGSMPTAGTDMISAASAENKHKPIVVCLMIPDGVVGYPMYGAGDWAIPGGYMEALRCRYVVQLALMSGMDVQQIRHLFEVDAISLKSDPFYTVRLYWFIFERVVMMTIQDCKDRLKGANEMLDLLVEDVTRPIGKRISEWLALFIGNVQRHRGIIRLA